MSNKSIYQLMHEVLDQGEAGVWLRIRKQLVGINVHMDFDTRTYRIDDITCELTPNSPFSANMTYAEFYQVNYQVDKIDPLQPMLISRRDGVTVGLIPQLCIPVIGSADMRKMYG